MRSRVVVAAVAVVGIGLGGVWGATRGSGASEPAPKLVKAERGDISVTVGGIGHVATLTDAARSSVSVAPASTGSAAAPASADALFAPVTGHVRTLLVKVGDRVTAGQPVAQLSDDGASQGALVQARSDLATAQLDLAQKKVQDPARGVPPTPAELASARAALKAAGARLHRITGRPLASDLEAARLEVARATSELEAERASKASRPEALAAAELAVTAANQRLAVLTGSPDPAELAAARLELAKAQLDQETLLRQPAPPSPSAVAAADAAVAAAQQRLADAQAAGVPADIAAATAELAKARSDRDALSAAADPPSATAVAAASLAVEAAQRKLDALLKPPASSVTSARMELARAQSDLAALRGGDSARVAAAKSAVAAAKSRLRVLVRPPTEVVTTARSEVKRAAADLAVLRQRGAPASATDLALARLRVSVASQQVQLAQLLADRLMVRAPASGTVTSVLTAAGAAVDPTTPLLRVQDLAHLVVGVALTEFDVSRTRMGAEARISADALGGRRFAGRVTDVALTGNDSGGVITFPVIISLGAAKDLRPGMSVSARVVVASRTDVLRIPVGAVEERDGKDGTIRVMTKSGELKMRVVKLGLTGGAFVEVTSGLREGEKVAIPAGEAA